ncbi:MAG: V-type ATPase 116kDa subunit family protein [Oscillospiraceae bacterium]
MGIAKMKYINVYGPEKQLNNTLRELALAECFHPDESGAEEYRVSVANNNYEPLLVKARGLLEDLGEPVNVLTKARSEYHTKAVEEYLEKFAAEIARRGARKADITSQLSLYSQARVQLYHLTGLTSSIDDLFSCTYLKVRFGRMPKDSYKKLSYYEDKHFTFTVYDFDGDYYWGVYFATTADNSEIDNIFSSLYFERIWVPDFIHGKPEDALAEITRKETELKSELAALQQPGAIATIEEVNTIKEMYTWLFERNQLFAMKHCATLFNHTFYIGGFVPQDDYEHLTSSLGKISGIKFSEQHDNEELPISPPVKLKNNRFVRPFEMYVTMYGLPSQGDIDPTWFVALTYSLFFGIMFGDLGQGIVVALVGYILQKYKKMPLGGILMRAGLFSGIFGCIYGSVFGFEHLLDPVYHAIGLASKPLEVFESINLILISSVVLGAFIVLCAIIFGVVSKFKRGKIGEAIFSPNGISGLVFYVSILIMAADMLLLHIGIVSTPFIIIGLVIPFICMYMCEPLERLVDTGKWHLENGIGDLLMSGFFEMFDTLLSYVTNTLSFLRIGGFVLCHAGMMSVVFTLAAMAGAAYWPVVVIGNIFVMCLEGLIVGIQALRLEFYEIFSRFFEADAVAFNPLRLQAHE